MAKLALLALAFAAIVAFSEVSAYTTITTTTITDDDFSNTRGSQTYQQCRRQIPVQEVNHCEMHLTQGTSQIRMPVESQQMPHLQLCCNQLQNIEQECQCEAIR
nr:hypothetical protein [Tanacetum cinerariifolium]